MRSERQPERVPSSAPDGEARVPALDGLRGIAILLVLVFHFSNLARTPTTFPLDRSLALITDSGWVGVDLFFVLSGFLITGILYDSKLGEHYFRNFYVRRCLRIFPLYYAFLLFMLLLLPVVQPMEPDAAHAISHDGGWYASYLTNVRVALDEGKRADLPVAGHAWSLAVEEQFYLVWPAVVLLLGRRQLLGACAACIASALAIRTGLAMAGVDHWMGYTLMPTRMDALAVGAFVALAVRDPNGLRRLARWSGPVAAGSLAIIVALAAGEGRFAPFDLGVRTVGYTMLAFLFGAVLLGAATGAPSTLGRRILAHDALRSLGKYSYALYLVHLPVAYFLSRRVDIAGAVPEVLGSSIPGQLVFMAAAAVPTFAIAWLSWHLLEKQFLKLKRLFPYSRREPLGRGAEAAVLAAVGSQGAGS